MTETGRFIPGLLFFLFIAGCNPTVTITSPEDGASYEAGETITFSCTAHDREDGELAGDAIIWISSIDGQFGTGALFETNVLSQGKHKITVTATDSHGVTAAAAITITIGPPTSTTTTISDTAATYYVSPDGNDAGAGSEASPWKTIQKAADTLQAGERVYIRAGTYNERVAPVNSGAAGKYIVYAAYPGDTVIIDGAGVTLADDLDGLFAVSGKSYIKISGLRIINAGTYDDNAGIFVGSSSDIVIEKNYTFSTVSSGIGVWQSSNIIIDGNEVERAHSSGRQECLTMAGTDTFEISNNHVHHGGSKTSGGEGITVKDGSRNGKVYGNHVHDLQRVGIYVDAWDKHTFNIDVFQNLVHDCGNDGIAVASEMGGLLENIKIYNNIAYHNTYIGMNISRNGPVATQPLKDILVVNNTFYNNGQSWGGGISVGNSDIENIVIRNNICSQNLSFQIFVPSTALSRVTIGHNLIDGYREYTDEGSVETRGSDYVEGDPQFTDAAGADFHLLAGSPAIDAGSAAGAPANDYDAVARPQGAGFDIGAFEFIKGK